MRLVFLSIALIFVIIPAFSQDRILVDCIHGGDFYFTSDGFTRMDLHDIFPEDSLTIVTSESLTGITNLVDTITSDEGLMTFTLNLPESSPAGYIQTLYVYLVDYNDHYSFVNGSISNPDGVIIQNLFAGNGHADNAYGSGWTVQIYFAVETMGLPKHIRIGYGNTLFSSSTHTGLYNPSDYDAFLSFYNNYYFAYLEDSPALSDTDTQSLSEAFQDGLSMMLAYELATAIPAKPFIHMYTKSPLTASVQLAVPGIRTLAQPKPIGDSKNFGWKDILLQPGSDNEHLWEAVSNKRFNFISFNIDGNQITCENQTDAPLYDLMLVKCIDPQHFRIGMNRVLEPGKHYSCDSWKVYDIKKLKEFLKQSIYSQCKNVHLTDEEAYHFAYEIPWVDILIFRAVQHPDQYFGFYRFDREIYDRLVSIDVQPIPSTLERNMWVMLSNIQPRNTEPAFSLGSSIEDEDNVQKQDYIYREYGMVDEHYSLANSSRDMSFFGFDIYEDGNPIYQVECYQNPFANEFAENTSSFPIGDYVLQFNIDNPEQNGIYHMISDAQHPIMFAKPFMSNGRLMVLGTFSPFLYNENSVFLNAAMHSLIHSPNLGTGIHDPVIPLPIPVALKNFPNPFNPDTVIEFSLPQKGKVDIELYNTKGQLIKRLISEQMDGGTHQVTWNGCNQDKDVVASQVILCRMHYLGREYIRKMVLLK